MPVLAQVRVRFEQEKPLDGVRIAASLHVTAETANLVRTLKAGGAEVALCASNPLSTQDDVAAALAGDAAVFARAAENPETYYRHIDAVLDTKPRLTIDDGADLVGVLHGQRTDLLKGILGGTEETTTGMIRLRALEAQGKLAFPVIAVADSVTGRQLDHRYGTGQSTLDGILRATNILLAGQRVVVIGYGACGRGVAIRAKGAGAHVIVCEVDELRALEAVLDGYDVMPATA
ncbi:MAG: adenosylhomocysteinase, partial [Thermoleophilaceae bacterium]|nr:adenosylhomocysteinase [Thermoleophilaceae bacterium]